MISLAQKGKLSYNYIAQKGAVIMSEINKQIGEKLKQYREIKEYSLSEVASMVGKSKSSIHAYEIGRVSISVDVLIDLCNVYGINYVDFLEDVQRSKK